MFRVTTDFSALRGGLNRQAGKLNDPQAGKELLDLIGIKTLSFVKLAYRAKSRRQDGGDGITWKELSEKTIESRVRSRAVGRNIVEKRRALAERIKAAKGKGSTKKKQDLRAKRKAELDKLNAEVAKEFANYSIGIDTGLQFNSSSPGYEAPDGKGGNVFRQDNNYVTVGFGRSYSKYFDEIRPLVPDDVPAKWLESIEGLVDKWVQDRVKGEL